MFQLLVILPYVERSGAGMLLTLCVLLSEWRARFGASIVAPLECRCKVLVQGVACCQSGVYSLERCQWRSGCCCRCCLRLMFEGAAVRVVCALNLLWNGHAGERMRVEGAAWGCCRASLLVLLQGVMLQGAARVRTVPNSCCKGASEGCCCTLQCAAVRVAFPLWSWLVVPLQGAASRCCS